MKGYNEHDIGNSQVLFYHSDLPKSKTPIIPLSGQAVASIGHEPTFDNYAKVSLEPTIFDQCVVLSLLNTCTSWQETPISVLHMHIDPPQKHFWGEKISMTFYMRLLVKGPSVRTFNEM